MRTVAKIDAQEADRVRETQLDAMRAAFRRIEQVNSDLNKALKEMRDEQVQFEAQARKMWLELMNELGVEVENFDSALGAQRAVILAVRSRENELVRLHLVVAHVQKQQAKAKRVKGPAGRTLNEQRKRAR